MTLRSRDDARGFTLAELLVAIVIAAFVVGATYGALSQVIRGRESVTARQQAFSRATLAAELIARDLESSLRDADLIAVKFGIVKGGSSAEPRDELMLFSHHSSPSRPWTEQAEGAEREAHYRIAASGLEPQKAPQFSLWRRIDPVPDETPEGGGVASPLVDGIVMLKVEAADAEGWFDEWDSDRDGIPHMVRVTVTAVDDAGRGSARARRTVAIDRVAEPTAQVYEEAGAEESGTGSTTNPPTATPPTTPPATGGTGTGGTGGGGTGGGRTPTQGGGGGTGGGATPR